MQPLQKSPRTLRVAEEIRCAISQILCFELRDPHLEGVTVTGVKVSPDLRFARIYYNMNAPERAKEALAALRKSVPLMRKFLAQQIALKFVPDLDFYYDESFELQARIDSLFLELDQKKKASSGSNER